MILQKKSSTLDVIYLTLEAPREGQASYVHVHEIINGLKKQGVIVKLYEPSYTARKISPNLLLRLLHAIILQIKLWFCWKKGSVLYIRAHYLAFPSALLARIFRVPVFQEVNGPYEDVFVTYPSLNKLRWLLIPMQRCQYRWCSGVIAVTSDLQEWVNTEGEREDCALISNGANIDVFKPGLERPADLPEKFVVFFGGLTRWHGVNTMLDAVQCTEWPQNVKLVVIGEGQETPRVKEAADRLDQIIYLGRLPYKSVAAYVANALAGLVIINNPGERSSTGVMPLKLFETLACGVPAIVTDLPGQADLVTNHDCGFVMPVDDAKALASIVDHIQKFPKEAFQKGVRGRNVVEKEHSWFVRSQQTLIFIQEKL